MSSPHFSNWVNGSLTAPTTYKITVHNPASGVTLATIDSTPRKEVESIVADSLHHFQYGRWARASAPERFNVLSNAAALVREHMDEFITSEVHQTGSPIHDVRTQLARMPEWLEYYASLASASVSPSRGKGPGLSTLKRHPVGVVVQITPWNHLTPWDHPLVITIKKLGAALAGGNVVIIKPSELTPLSVLRLGFIFKLAGLPDGTLQIVSGTGGDTGLFLCEQPQVAHVDLKGGLVTHKAIAPLIAVADRNKVRLTFDVGGKSPVCIFPSASIEEAVEGAVFAMFLASGQSCVSGSRLLVHTDIYDVFMHELVARTRALRVGYPFDSSTQVGPVNAAILERCKGCVARAVEQGGRILCGGRIIKYGIPGCFFEPTLIETSWNSDLERTEVFGPVIAVIRCTSEEEIIKIANSSGTLLTATVWTQEPEQADRAAASIGADIVWVNGKDSSNLSSQFKEKDIDKKNGWETYKLYTKVD